jgi:hypothetical protein
MLDTTIFFDEPTKQQSPQSALEAAVKVGSVPIVQQLVEAATPAPCRQWLSGQYGHSALSFAVAQDASLGIVQLLLDADAPVVYGQKPASILSRAAVKFTEWLQAAGCSHTGADVVRLLLAAVQRAAGSSDDTLQNEPTASALKESFLVAVRMGCADVAELFLQLGSSALSDPGCMDTALHAAADSSTGSADVVQLLLKHGAQVNSVLEGSTALSKSIKVAILFGDTEIMTVLLDAGADPSMKSEDGRTALQQAIQMGLGEAYAISDDVVDYDDDGDSDYDDDYCTEAFECLLAHSSQPLSAGKLVSTAWRLAGTDLAKLGKQSHRDLDYMSDSDSKEDRTAEQREAQHSMLCSLLKAAAAKDSTAAQAELSKCVKQVENLHSQVKSSYDGCEECTCGNCMPQPTGPHLIQRAHLILRAMSEVWLASAAVDVAAQRSAVQHMLVSAAASVKHMQHLQQQQPQAATDVSRPKECSEGAAAA